MAENDELRQMLQAGVEAARRGDRPTGRRLLEQVIEADPNNELAWIWLASCVTSMSERRACLERVLQINPNNARAQEALRRLNAAEGTGQSERAERTIDQVRRAQRTPVPVAEEPRGAIDIINLAIGLLAVAAVIGLLFLFSPLGLGGGGDNNQAAVGGVPTQEVPSTPLPTPTPIPTRAPNLFQGTSRAPTLPPTFTPTPTLPPTRTPTPTETPYPLEQMVVLYTSLEDGETQPSLYRINGDGTNEIPLGSGFRDVAFAPSGNQIAFVRDVEYPSQGGEPQIFPELFVADLNNLDNARQITELRTSIVASPTWGPEGREIVFVNNFDDTEDLWYITEDGNNLRRLTVDEYTNRDPSWSPILGSRQIIFASDRSSFGSTELFSFEITEPSVEPVYTRLTTENNSSFSPSWSHDGTMITFVSDRSGDADIYIMNPDGSTQRLLTIDDGGAEDRRPQFTSDGRYVAFISNREDDRFQVYLVSLQGDVLVRLTNSNRDDMSITYRPELILRLR